MDNEINAAFRDVLKGFNCLPNNPLWDNTSECNKFHECGCDEDVVWVVSYLGASRSAAGCGRTLAQGQFQISLFGKSGKGTFNLYEAADCLICAIEDACKHVYVDKRTKATTTLILSGQGQTLPITGPLLTGDTSGRVLLPITIPFRAYYCC